MKECLGCLGLVAGGDALVAVIGTGGILRLLLDGRPRTRGELVALTGLSRTTVLSRVDTLLATGLIRNAGEAVSSGGRPPTQIVFNSAARLILAVDLGATHGAVALTDLSAEILVSRRAELAIGDGPEPVLEWVVRTAGELLAQTGRPRSDIAAVGIGLPGPVEHASGRPVHPPIMPGWDRFDVPGFVGAHYPVPVLVDNDVNLLALGEQATVWPQVQDLLFVKVSTGIGAGIISGGRLQRGAQGSAGDIGHVRVPWRAGSILRPQDDERDLEEIASRPAIARALASLGLVAETTEQIAGLISSGNREAIDVTREAGREIGQVLATCVNLLNPSIIVVGGSVVRSGHQLLAGIRESVYRTSMPLATQYLDIVPSRDDGRAGAVGAAVMAIQRVLSAENVDAMSVGR